MFGLLSRLHRWLLRPRLFPVGFVVGGAMKAGTTALSSFLDQHPEVCMANGKEAHFFDADENFPPDRKPDLSIYHAKFAPRPTTRILGDATPIYLWWEPAAERAMAYNPALKWVILLRHPAERAYSHWNAFRKAGHETLGFEEALAAEAPRRAAVPFQERVHSYVDRGFFARQLRRLFQIVPRRQVLVLRNEELRHDHTGALRRVFEFIGVCSSVQIQKAWVFSHEYEQPMSPALKARLTALFADDIRDLERLLGWELSDWLR
jgi:hypothetical protein